MSLYSLMMFFFFFNDTATTEIYTLSLHDALPISGMGTETWVISSSSRSAVVKVSRRNSSMGMLLSPDGDRKSTRLNSSHSQISYAVFCLKKKKTNLEYNIVTTHHYVVYYLTRHAV